MKKVNCLTRCLWHWSKYGGNIMYDSNHATIVNSGREYLDSQEMDIIAIDIKEYGYETILNLHRDFINYDELLILKRYFNQ